MTSRKSATSQQFGADWVYQSLLSAQCDVAKEPLFQLQRLHDATDAVGQRIETKAALFLGLSSGVGAFGADRLAQGTSGHCLQAAMFGALFLTSALFLLLALTVRKHKAVRVETILAAERLSCTSGDLTTPWKKDSSPSEQDKHSSEHRRAFARYLSEQLAEAVVHDLRVNGIKARRLKIGTWLFAAQALLLIVCLAFNGFH